MMTRWTITITCEHGHSADVHTYGECAGITIITPLRCVQCEQREREARPRLRLVAPTDSPLSSDSGETNQ